MANDPWAKRIFVLLLVVLVVVPIAGFSVYLIVHKLQTSQQRDIDDAAKLDALNKQLDDSARRSQEIIRQATGK